MPNTVTLDPDLESYINSLVTSGHFASRAAVLSEGAKLVAAYAAKLHRFDEEMKSADSPSVAGDKMEASEAFADMRLYLDTLLTKRAA